jgi:hypothetical protein
VWAVVACVPDAPPQLWNGVGIEPVTMPDATTFAQRVRQGQLRPVQTVLVHAKLRPVLLLQERPRGVLPELIALGMVGLEALSTGERDSIREQLEPSLFHLPVRQGKYGLSREMAVDLNALVRIHASAMIPQPVGHLDDNEMRVIGERLIQHLDIDLEPLVTRLVEERLTQLNQQAVL